MVYRWFISALVVATSMLSLGCLKRPTPGPPPQAILPPPPLPRREPIYFLKGDASLSPGALAKLQTWTSTWSTGGTWSLACPEGAAGTYPILEARIRALRTELGRLQVVRLETRLAPKVDPGVYDPIYVEMDPFGSPWQERPILPWMARTSPKSPATSPRKPSTAAPAKACWVRRKPRTASRIQVAKLVLPK